MTLLLAWAAPAALCVASHRENAFDLIGEAPAEARLVVAMHDAERHRRHVSALPVTASAQRLLQHFNTYNAYVELLRAGSSEPEEAFDRLLGRRFCFFAGEEEVGDDWALYAEAERQAIVDMLSALDGKLRRKNDGVAIFTIEDGRFLVGQKDDRWLLGPAEHRRLFDRALPLLRGEALKRPLRETEVYRQARFVGRGDTAYLRVEDAEHNAFAACVIRHWRRRIEADLAIQSPKLRDELRDLPAVDPALLDELAPQSALALVEPLPDRAPRAYQLLRELLPEIEIDPALRPQLGPRMALVVRPGDAPAMHVFWCLEVRSCARAGPALDRMMTQALAAREVPAAEHAESELRLADLTPLLRTSDMSRRLFGDEDLVLGWRAFPTLEPGAAAEEEDLPGWWVIGVPAHRVLTIGRTLATAPPPDEASDEAVLSHGSLSGPQAARVLARLPAPVLQSFAEVLTKVDGARWQLHRTSDQSLEAKIRIKLEKGRGDDCAGDERRRP